MEWLPYPQNMPQENKEYLVCKGAYVMVASFCLNYKFYDSEKGNYYGPAWENESLGGVHEDITAFMEKPQPYKGE